MTRQKLETSEINILGKIMCITRIDSVRYDQIRKQCNLKAIGECIKITKGNNINNLTCRNISGIKFPNKGAIQEDEMEIN